MLTVQSATIGYGRTVVARDINMSVVSGEVVAVLGTNGSGKSTLVRTLLGLQSLLSGEVGWNRDEHSPVAYLSQLDEFDRYFPMDVTTLVSSGSWGQKRRGLGASSRVESALAKVDMLKFSKTPIHQLSGGQLQRARFARAMVQDSDFIILDEPFSAVDQRREEQFMNLINSWAHEGRAVLMIMHDLSAALRLCSRALLLGEGGGDFGKTSEILSSERLVARGYMSQTQVDVMHEAAHG